MKNILTFLFTALVVGVTQLAAEALLQTVNEDRDEPLFGEEAAAPVETVH